MMALSNISLIDARPLCAVRIAALLQILGIAAMLSVLAPISIPVPGLPAPLTLQTLAVGTAGLWFGAPRAFSGVALWILWGALGAPVWAGAVGGLEVLMSMRGGYLLAMPVAAFICGSLRSSSLPRVALYLAGSLTVLIGGAMGCWIHHDWQTSIQVAVVPYLSVEAFKAICGHFGSAALARLRVPKNRNNESL